MVGRIIARVFYDDLFVQRRLAHRAHSSAVKEQIVENLLRQIFAFGEARLYTSFAGSLLKGYSRAVSISLKGFPAEITDEVLSRIFDIPPDQFIEKVWLGFVNDNYDLIIAHPQSHALALGRAFSAMARWEKGGWQKVVAHPRASVESVVGAVILFSNLPTDVLSRVVARDNSRPDSEISSMGFSESTLEYICQRVRHRTPAEQEAIISALREHQEMVGDPQTFQDNLGGDRD